MIHHMSSFHRKMLFPSQKHVDNIATRLILAILFAATNHLLDVPSAQQWHGDDDTQNMQD